MNCKLEIGSDDVPYIEVGKNVLRLDTADLNDEYREKSRKELRETPEIRRQSCERLRELLKGEPDLYLPTDDETLCMLLRPCKFYPESAFRLACRFYKFKTKYPVYCLGITLPEIRKVYEAEVITFVPTRCPNGERIMIIHPGTKWNPKEISVTELIRAVFIMVEVPMIEPRTQVGGVHIILDMKGLSLGHITQFTPRLAQIILEFVQGCVPLRLKTINIVNQSFIFNMLFAIFKPFIGEKLKRRIFFHGTNWESLQKIMPKDCLPIPYDGTIENCPGKLIADLLDMYEKEFQRASTYGYKKKSSETKSINS